MGSHFGPVASIGSAFDHAVASTPLVVNSALNIMFGVAYSNVSVTNHDILVYASDLNIIPNLAFGFTQEIQTEVNAPILSQLT